MVTWRLNLSTALEATVVLGSRSFDIGHHGLRIAESGERVVFRDCRLTFIGTTATWLSLSIRAPGGNVRVLWNGADLIVEQRYLLTQDAFVVRYHPIDNRETPPLIFVDCFGQHESRVHLRHHDNVYVVRFEPDYPVSVAPWAEYMVAQLTFMREFRAGRQESHATHIRRVRPCFRPRTPQTPGARSAETESGDDDNSNHESEW